MAQRSTLWRLLIAHPGGVHSHPLATGAAYPLSDEPQAARVISQHDGTLSLEVPPGASAILLNDVQVGVAAELRSGDQLRTGELNVVVQAATEPASGSREKLWPRADFDVRLREEAERARGAGRPLGYFVVRSRHLAALRQKVGAAVRPPERVIWGALGAEALEGLVVEGPGHGARAAIEEAIASGEAGPGALLGAVSSPPEAGVAHELVEQALARIAGHHAGAHDELLVLEPISVRLRALLERAADAGRPLLLEGEAGTGKLAWAWHAHQRSGRRAAWWRVVDCRATRQVLGVATAVLNHGTLALRHVDALPADAQRELVDRWPDDVTVIATRTPGSPGKLLPELAAKFERATLPIPALRDRPSELIPLALQAVQQARARFGRPRLSLGQEARAALQDYDWPGNVRELRNAVGLAALAAEADELRPENLPPEVLEHWRGRRASRAGEDLRSSLKSAEKDALLKVLAQTRWNVTAAAKELGLPRRTVVYRMGRLGLRRPAR